MSDSLPIREVVLRDFEGLIAFCESLLFDAKQKFPNRVRSAELMVRARNLVRRVCGEGSEHYRVLLELARIDQPAAYVPRLQGVLLAAMDDFREGRFFEFRHVIEAEVLGTFMDRAGAYSTRVQERIVVLAGIRDNADQGKSEAFRRDEVEAMARWVRAFAADSLV